MSVESDFNQLLVYQNLVDEYNKMLFEKYKSKFFIVTKSPPNFSYFKKNEIYAISGVDVLGGEIYLTSYLNNMHRTISLKNVKII